MWPPEPFGFGTWALWIEFTGALVIVAHGLAAGAVLLRSRAIEAARIWVADGILAGLSFKLAATLLKTLELRSWEQVLLFLVILAIRTGLKQVFRWERERGGRALARLGIPPGR